MVTSQLGGCYVSWGEERELRFRVQRGTIKEKKGRAGRYVTAVAFQVVRKRVFSNPSNLFSNNYFRPLPSQPHPHRKRKEKRGEEDRQIQTEETSFKESSDFSQPGCAKSYPGNSLLEFL